MACDGAVVVTVVVTVTVALSVNELGDDVQVPAGIALTHETVTGPLNPPEGANISGKVAGCPAATMAEVEPPGGVVIMISAPLPERVMACGLAGALSVMLIAPARAPVAVGVKVTEMLQEALAAKLVPQLSVSAKSPLALILVIASGALPGLVSVTGGAEIVELTS